jgi:decaprenylphospho-beta-D-ribofuranose 2-oxidase
VAEAIMQQELSGWGGMNPESCDVFRPEKRRSLSELVECKHSDTLIARGLGRSYGDAAVNGGNGVVNTTRLDRMLDFDPEEAVLECEAGVSLADIIDVFLPRGYFVPVTPGTRFVTVGGAIANDVHGKNHHCDGTFCEYVESFTLLIPSGDVLTCSRDENEDVFWATAGGVGLTGIILTARVRLMAVESAYISADYTQCTDLDHALDAMAERDEDYQYSVAWVDCLAKGKHLGRSVLMQGNHAHVEQLPGGRATSPFEVKGSFPKVVPFNCPSFVLNPLSIQAFNTAFYAAHPTSTGKIVDYGRYFYPLDTIQHWNRLYGKNGFAQFQATLPFESKQGLVSMLERLAKSRRASFLAVLKTFGEQNPGLLSHPMKGYTLTLDLPNRGDLTGFLAELDTILLDHGGRLYLAKDAVATPDMIAAMYPRLDEFKAIQKRLDPKGVLSSSMARRLGLVG